MLALLRFVENPRDRVAGFRVMQLIPGVGPTSAQRVLDHMADARRSDRGACRRAGTAARRRRLGDLRRRHRRDLRRLQLAGRPRTRPAVVRTASRPDPRGCRDPPRRSDPARTDRERLSFAGALPHRTDARSARCDQRPGGGSPARRGLSDPVDDPFRQGPGMEVGVRPQCRRRLHALRPRRRNDSRDRGRTPPALCRHDARQGRSASHCAAALLHPRPARARATGTSMPRGRVSFPIGLLRPVRTDHVADRCGRNPTVRAASQGPRIDVGARMRGMWR